ncbi:MAG: InlB B-repeat-containing protein, partial [Planctomycetota bacterium]
MRYVVLAACSIALFAAVPALHADYELTVNVIGNGTVEPNGGVYPEYGRPKPVALLSALPDPGHMLKSWAGTDDDSSTALTNTVVMDSNETVTVTFAPAMIVTTPSGSELWSAGSTHNIEWSSYDAGAVYLFFSENGGLYWELIAGNIPDTGSYRWQIPYGLSSDNCTILAIPGIPNPNAVITGSAPFAIQPYSPGAKVEAKWESLGGDFERSGLSEGKGLSSDASNGNSKPTVPRR